MAEKKGIKAKGRVLTTDTGKNEKDKIFAMWAGVVFFMVLIFIFWIFVLRADFKNDSASDQGDNFDWTGIKQEFSQTIQDVRDSFEEINELREEISEEAEEPLSEEQIEELKNKIINQSMVEENSTTSSDEIINN